MAADGRADARLGSRLGGYRLEAIVGRGGMGTVYRAEELRLGRKVAIKLIAPELAGEERFRERFLRESRVAASLDHPHIVPLLGAGESDGTLYLAMRYVEGADLAEVIAEGGPLDPERAVALLEQVAEALDAAHERGLAHRDVKPGNILVARAGGREHAYLSDFGLARELSSLSGHSTAGQVLGTLDYLAPEQIQGQRVDGRTDVYALACVLYECLTGTPPFARATEIAALWAHVHEQPPSPSSSRPELGGTLDAALSRGLAKQPEDRQASCGELLAEVRAALQPGSSARPAEDAVAVVERKVVTVLVADLAGLGARGEALDVEDVAATLAPHRERLRSDLERFGGTVEESVGDAVVAVFGAPVVHEDDPERAVRAAFAVVEWVREDETMQVRIGIDTGEALVMLRTGGGERTVAGEVISSAARLQGAAPPDGILVGEQTHRATRERIEYREGPPVAARGKAGPAPVWVAVEARSRFGVDTVHASAAPLAGRHRELTLLVDALARVRAERAPQLVTLIGVPGIGKSRLVYELMRASDAEPAPILWRQGRCLPYGDGVTFWALGEIVKSQAGIFETDEAGPAEQKLTAMLAGLLEDPSERAWVETHLRPLVGLSGDALVDDETGAFAAWIRFVEALADEHPLVLVVEDLHWADEKLLDFLDQLMERLTDVEVLLIATARPELLQRRASWGGGKPNAVALSLSPLGQEDMARLLDALLDGLVLPPEVQSAVLARADGNPLFAEQYARMLSERGGGRELPLPESVQGIIAARLDGLPRAEKELLHDAAVHGKVFWTGALEAMSGAAAGALDEPLRALERKEFVRRQRRSSVAGETELAFRHALLREVAYSQIPRAQRADKHRLAAEWLESLAHDRDDLVELLADHYSHALELARAAGRATAGLEARARATLRDAGVRAATLNAFAAALRYLDGALELWPVEDEERPHLLALRARALHFLGAEAAADALTEARDALLAIGDSEAAAELEPLLAELWWEAGDRDRALAQLEDARSLLGDSVGSRAKGRILGQLARFYGLKGDTREAIVAGEEARAIARALGDKGSEGSALHSIGVARMGAGDLDGAVEDLGRAIGLLLAANSPEATRACRNLQVLLGSRGEFDRGREAADEAALLARRFGDARMLRHLRTVEAGWHLLEGNWNEASRLAGEFIAECEAEQRAGSGLDETMSPETYPARPTPPALESTMRANRAYLRAVRGDDAGAIADVERALALARIANDTALLCLTLATALSTMLFAGRSREARRFALQLLEPLHGTGVRESLHVLYHLATTAGEIGLDKEVAELLARAPDVPSAAAARAIASGDFLRAAKIYEQFHYGPGEAHVRLLAAKAFAAEGRREEADEQLQRALAFFRKAGATRFIEEAEGLLHADA